MPDVLIAQCDALFFLVCSYRRMLEGIICHSETAADLDLCNLSCNSAGEFKVLALVKPPTLPLEVRNASCCERPL